MFHDAAGTATAITRDAAGHVTKIDYGDGSRKVTERNEDGRWTRTEWRGHRTQRELDSEGRTVVELQDGSPIWKEYCPSGEVQSIVDANGRRVQYAYNDEGRVEEVIVGSGEFRDGIWQASRRQPQRVHQFVYDRAGNWIQWKLPADKWKTASTTRRGRLIRQEILHNDRVILEREYQYDAGGRVIRKSDSRRGVTRYGYDDVGRLTSVSSDQHTTSYRYDAKEATGIAASVIATPKGIDSNGIQIVN